VKIKTKKRRKGLQIYTAQITINAMEIEASSPLISRGMIILS
jgi:hypothetical protein